MSAGFAVDRMLLAEPDTQLVFEEHPPASPAPQSIGAPEPSQAAAAPTAPVSAGPGSSHKRIHRPATSARPSTPGPARLQSGSSSARTTAEDAVARLTNSRRVKAGCRPLRIDGRLRSAARLHSADMAAHDYFGHIAPGGGTFVDRLKGAGYLLPGAENIAKGYQTSTQVMDGWMKSPGHRSNILNCNLRAIGVGVQFGSGGPWWTQDFGWQ
jgi:uncharacterized protein YkwD